MVFAPFRPGYKLFFSKYNYVHKDEPDPLSDFPRTGISDSWRCYVPMDDVVPGRVNHIPGGIERIVHHTVSHWSPFSGAPVAGLAA